MKKFFKKQIFKQSNSILKKINFRKFRFLSEPLVFFIIGIIIGAALVYIFYSVDNSSYSVDNSRFIGKRTDLSAAASYLKFKEIKDSLIPLGSPDIYGQELNISFDKAQEAIDTVAPFDPTYGQQKIVLTGSDLERYINVGSQIACQYCCGVTTLVFKSGEAACGCDHSQMMRGLSAYLIKNHPDVPDEKILEELAEWKAVFFPKQTLTAKLQELEKSGEPGIREILEEFPEFMPSMVGGC